MFSDNIHNSYMEIIVNTVQYKKKELYKQCLIYIVL